MLPFFTLLKTDKSAPNALYLQLASQLTNLIREGTIRKGQRVPSSRSLSQALSVHRKTVVQAYEELLAQGWLESRTGSGTFVSKNLPEIKPTSLATRTDKRDPILTSGFPITPLKYLHTGVPQARTSLHLDDGFPDARLVPAEEIARAYRSQLLLGNPYEKLGYSTTLGSLWLRNELTSYLNETRFLNITAENILITRGTMMAMHLVSSTLLEKGQNVVVTEMGWSGANMNFIQAGATLNVLPADDFGMHVDALELLCTQKPIRLVYLTSHHHYPTTAVLRADRRLRLLSLAEKYGFIILEDDYDYDFHYQSKPLLPLAGADKEGMVLYCGSFTKTISPAFRVGYLVAPQNVVEHLGRFRRIIDRQGDTLLENTVADLLSAGVIQRHLRKSLRLYRERRDLFCSLLATLKPALDFTVPEGGMAVWTQFDPRINLEQLSAKALKKDLYFSPGYGLHDRKSLSNGTRLGFASSNPEELHQCVDILRSIL